MENKPIYTDNEQTKGIFGFIILFVIGIYVFQHQTIAGIFVFLIAFLTLMSTMLHNSRLVLYDDKVVIENITYKKEIPFSSVKRIFSEERPYGIHFQTRIYLVIEYIETSGYGDEISYIFDQKMYDDINEKYTAYKSAMNKI
jgi:hypothetical protein